MKKGLQYLGEVVEEIKRCGMTAGEKVAKKKVEKKKATKKGKKSAKKLEVIESEEESESSPEMEEEETVKGEEEKTAKEEEEKKTKKEEKTKEENASKENEKAKEDSSASILIPEENEVEEVATSISEGPEELPTEVKAASPRESQSTDKPAVHKEDSPKKDADTRLSNAAEKDAESDSYFDEPEY